MGDVVSSSTDAPAHATVEFTLPAISTPKSGGAVREISEKFSVNAATGTSTITVPLYTTPGRSGCGPSLSLSYDSGSGNGPFGFGWTLSAPRIVRKTDRGLPRYDGWNGSDVFTLAGSEDLVPFLVQVGGLWQEQNPPPRPMAGSLYQVRRYRPRIEGNFTLIERWSSLTDPKDVCWRSITRDNQTHWYGKTDESRIRDPADASRIFSWLLCETCDDKGNAIVYRYASEDSNGVDLVSAPERNRTAASRSANRYLKRIQYGNRTPYFPVVGAGPLVPFPTDWCFEVVMDFGEHDAANPLPAPAPGKKWNVRPDPFSAYRAGFEVRTYRICHRVLMFHHFPGEPGVGEDCVVRSTDLTYSHEVAPLDPANPIYSFLVSVQQTGYRRSAGGGYVTRSVPKLAFEYSQPRIDTAVREVEGDSLENLAPITQPRRQWLDLDSEGSVGMLAQEQGALLFKRNLSAANLQLVGSETRAVARFAPVETVETVPSWGAASISQTFVDLAGDGHLSLARFEPGTAGFFKRRPQGAWDSFRNFTQIPVLDWASSTVRLVDLSGDGTADVLITEDDVFSWHESLGEDGFGPRLGVAQAGDEELGPRLTFADLEESIFLADMTGDGLVDLVRIRNGEVCYWPSLGYGHFGAKVAMAAAPEFEEDGTFDARRIRIADVDGSGTSDIIYIGSGGIDLYFNQSGNSWSPARPINAFPDASNVGAISAFDFLGIGTACLVWTSPLESDAPRPVRYLDLMGGQKPHLLTAIDNNLGAETRIEYAPSTRFYVADLLAGTPWITKLPFPVQVVERVVVWDHVSRNRYTTRYAYHHGYFDGVEREFRGFGMVEQWDGEEFAALASLPALPAPTNLDSAFYAPRVLKRTWFHVGAYLERDAFLKATHTVLAGTVLPPGLSVEEEREACRALRGTLLREETYALDGSAKELFPYAVREETFGVKCLQPRGPNPFGVFLAHPHESLSHAYERDMTDPRVNHTITVEIDAFGNIRKVLAIAYPRLVVDPALSPADQNQQRQLRITYTESDFTNAIAQPDAYRTPLPSVVRNYELTGFSVPAGKNRFDFDDWMSAPLLLLMAATDIDFEVTPNPTLKQRRLIGESRVYYRSDTLAAMLPLHAIGTLGLRGRAYELSITPGLLSKTFQRKVGASPLENLLPAPAPILSGTGADRGGYVDLDGDGKWWRPSGRAFFWTGADPVTPASTAVQELSVARQHFFLPQKFVTCFGREGTVTYDSHTLFTLSTQDAEGNTVSCEYDYRVLQPRMITDVNGNQVETAFDALAHIAGTALQGKPGQATGDTLAGFDPDPPPALLDSIFDGADPQLAAPTLLAGATSRSISGIDRFTRSRALNPGDPTKWQPVYAVQIARETHVSDLAPGQKSRLQISFAYADGLGRGIQDKRQAEPGPVVPGGPVVSPRWIASGWTVYNNKGAPVRKYEPFFSQLASRPHQFEFGIAVGVSSVSFYDPLGRAVARVNPNGSYEKFVFTSWKHAAWDPNDTCTLDPRTDLDVKDYVARFFSLQPPGWKTWRDRRILGALGAAEQQAATQATVHAGTPGISHLDALGRVFLTLADNGPDAGGNPRIYASRSFKDIQGNTYEVRDTIVQAADAQGRIVARYVHDMLGAQLYQASFETGERWTLSDALGNPIRGWNGRRYNFRYEYDGLRRAIRSFVKGGDPSEPNAQLFPTELNFLATTYGDSAATGLTSAQRQQRNLRLRVYQLRDGSGVANTERYDFKGNPAQGTRRLTSNYRDAPDWAAAPALDPEIYTQSAQFDALDRAISITSADGSVTEAAFNEAGLLDSVRVRLRGAATPTPFVKHIEYDAKGQRNAIEYGTNGAAAMAVTRYEYDPETFHLRRLLTTRSTPSNGLASQLLKTLGTLQDLKYVYDAVGNLTQIADDALPTLVRNGETISAVGRYEYDALYRLIEARGREHAAQCGLALPVPPNARDVPFAGLSQLNDPQALRNYTEEYFYDAVGNPTRVVHTALGGTWTRAHDCLETSQIEDGVKSPFTKTNNRLSSTTLQPQGAAPIPDPLAYDAHGNIVKMLHLPLIAWDFADRLRATSRQVAAPGREQTFYLYDATGQRARKVTERADGTRKSERLYLPGCEIYREYGAANTISFVRESQPIMDGTQRIALAETETVTGGIAMPSPIPLQRFQFGNHLGSSCMELDAGGAIISYEEYHPYGTSSFQAGRSVAEVSLKRYRYCGKERDEETGWSYHGARYFAPWLARWTNPDPIGIADGLNVYRYVSNNPVNAVDPSGTQEDNAHKSDWKPDKSMPHDLTGALHYLQEHPGDCSSLQHHVRPTEEPPIEHPPPEEPKHPLQITVSRRVMKSAKEQWNRPNADVSTKAAIAFSVTMMLPLYPLEMILNTPDLFETTGEHLALAYYDKPMYQGYHLLHAGTSFGEGIANLLMLGEARVVLSGGEAAAAAAPAALELRAPTVARAASLEGGSVGAAKASDPFLANMTSKEFQPILKAARRKAEKDVFARTLPLDPEAAMYVQRIRIRLAYGDRVGASTDMHSLISSYLRPLEGGGEALINRRLMTPGGITEYRIPDVQLLDINYSTPTVSGVWDFKAVNLNEYSYRLSPQFMDIRRATSITPTPLYYRLPVQRTLRPPPGL